MWKGINEFTQHKCRFILLEESYLGYPTDILYGNVQPFNIIEVLSNTDFFIFTTNIAQFSFYPLHNKLNRNNHLIMTYGTEVRQRPADYLMAWLRTDAMVVTSHDYTQSNPVGFSAQHIPIMIDFREISERQPPGDDVVRVFHSPTSPQLKGTDLFLKAIENIKAKDPALKVEPVLVEGKPWKECLQEKSRCDIVYDQMAIGSYGMGTVESWAMGLPVIGRASPWLRSWYPDLPIVDAFPDSLESRLENLIRTPLQRQEAGRLGQLFCKQNHDLETNIRKLMFLVKHVQER